MEPPHRVDAGAAPPPGSLLLPHRSVDSFSLEASSALKQATQSSDGPDEGPGSETLDGEEDDAADLAVLKLLEVELDLESSEEQSDSDSSDEEDDPGDVDLVDLLETRLRKDGIGVEGTRRIAEQVVQIRTKRDEWESVRANIEAANAAYDEILSEFAERRREIEECGVEVKMGPMPPGNPLAVFILDFLYWPHDKVSHDVGYLDTSILTYRNLGQYGFYDTIRSGQSTVMQTHLCQAHSSSAKSPTHPRNGVFSCDQAVQELCRWFSQTVYQTRLSLHVPGFIFGYGAYNKKYLARLRKGVPTITSATMHRSVKPLKRDAALVVPRSFPFVAVSAAEAGSQPFSFEWDVDHPSSYAYAGTSSGLRGALEGLSYALTLVARRKPFFQRKARAIYRVLLWRQRIAYSSDAEWDQKISNAYYAALKQGERLASSDADESDARDSFSLSKLATMLDNVKAVASTEGKAEQHDRRVDESRQSS
ncbi:hypothetical protein JCM8115_006385 [Rhodotorula mucilaginosa]